ncbi:MAG: VCBS repeat-containing protein [bacterium]|nr:VCBS repeat-containing protein [bacterium]
MTHLRLLICASSLALPAAFVPALTRAETSPADNEIAQDAASSTLIWADYDNDKLLDNLCLSGTGGARLLRNAGDGTFDDMTLAAGLSEIGSPRVALWVDFDLDGFSDLFVGGAGPAALYRNLGEGTFFDVTREAGLRDAGSLLAARWFDFDGDNLLDVHITTETGDVLYHNAGQGTFVTTNLQPRPGELRPAGSARLNGAPGTSSDPFPICGVPAIWDAALPLMCIDASSEPALGSLFPMSVELNVDPATRNVGIGTTAPDAQLHVIGDIRATGDLLAMGNQSAARFQPLTHGAFATLPGSNEVPIYIGHEEQGNPGVNDIWSVGERLITWGGFPWAANSRVLLRDKNVPRVPLAITDKRHSKPARLVYGSSRVNSPYRFSLTSSVVLQQDNWVKVRFHDVWLDGSDFTFDGLPRMTVSVDRPWNSSPVIVGGLEREDASKVWVQLKSDGPVDETGTYTVTLNVERSE